MSKMNAIIFGSLLTGFTLGAGVCIQFGYGIIGTAFIVLAVATLLSAELWVKP